MTTAAPHRGSTLPYGRGSVSKPQLVCRISVQHFGVAPQQSRDREGAMTTAAPHRGSTLPYGRGSVTAADCFLP